jgi:hypothetical protein
MKRAKLSVGLISKVLRREDVWGSGGIAPPFLISALDGGRQLHALGVFTHGETATDTHGIGGWVGPIALTVWRRIK